MTLHSAAADWRKPITLETPYYQAVDPFFSAGWQLESGQAVGLNLQPSCNFGHHCCLPSVYRHSKKKSGAFVMLNPFRANSATGHRFSDRRRPLQTVLPPYERVKARSCPYHILMATILGGQVLMRILRGRVQRNRVMEHMVAAGPGSLTPVLMTNLFAGMIFFDSNRAGNGPIWRCACPGRSLCVGLLSRASPHFDSGHPCWAGGVCFCR